jgi:hypothetical protein
MFNWTFGMVEAYFDTVTSSFKLPFSKATIQVIILVVLAIGTGLFASFEYNTRPLSASIRQAYVAFNNRDVSESVLEASGSTKVNLVGFFSILGIANSAFHFVAMMEW